MTRKEKYPETKYFHFHNENPHNRIAGDCAIRAIALATGVSWEETIKRMTELGLKYGYMVNDKSTIAKYLESLGWVKFPQKHKDNGKKLIGKEFCEYAKLRGYRTAIMNIGTNHMVCMKDFKIWDIWDSTGGCVGNFWVKGK